MRESVTKLNKKKTLEPTPETTPETTPEPTHKPVSTHKEAAGLPRFLQVVRCYTLFAGFVIFYELAFQLLVGSIGAGFFRALLFSIIGAAVLTLVLMTLPRLAALIVSEITLLFLSALYISQLLYSRIFQEFYSIDKIATGGDAITQFGGILLTTIWRNAPAILLLLLPVAVVALLYRLHRIPFGSRLPVKYALMPAVALIAVRLIILVPVAGDPYSARAVRYGLGDSSHISSMREVGLIATLELDLLSGFIETETSSVLKPYAPPPVILSPPTPSNPTGSPATPESPVLDPGSIPQGGAQPLPSDDISPAPPPIPFWVGKVNGFDIDFDSLIERDSGDNGLVQLHEYFASLEPGSQNEKTGIFKGYNLITICAEAFTHYVIDPDLTPTLYMMQQEGIYFDNFYGLAGGGTIGGEISLITGLAPRGGESWCKAAAKKYLPFSFASMFNSMGIKPIAYHNGSYTYYERNVWLPDLGYDFRARNHGLDFQGPGWHISDRLMVELSIDQYINDDRFYVHYMTISGHSPYSFEENSVCYWNRDAVKHLPYSPQVRAYLACQLELEYMMNYLLDRLEEKGIADRTLIVMTTDHYPYGLAVRDIAELAGHPLDIAFGLHKNACLIYTKRMEHTIVEAPAFVPDILPTVLNLLGLPYDSRFLSGRDVFSDALPLIFLDGGHMTNAGSYDRSRGKFVPFEGYEIPEGYASAISSIVDMRRSAEERILRRDYFEVIDGYLIRPAAERAAEVSALD